MLTSCTVTHLATYWMQCTANQGRTITRSPVHYQ